MAKLPALMLWTDAWVADTHHLHRYIRGTYHDLLILMWRSPGCTVPNDDAWLAKRLRMTPEEVSTELRPIISEFCQTDGNRLWQKRLMAEYKRALQIGRDQTARAKRRWDKEKNYTQAVPEPTTRQCYPQPQPQPHIEESKKEPPPSADGFSFDEFWLMYPNKVSKEGRYGARAAFERVRKSGVVTFAELMGGLRRYCAKQDFRQWKNPATWLNQHCWSDVPLSVKPGGYVNGHAKPTTIDVARDLINDIAEQEGFRRPASKH